MSVNTFFGVAANLQINSMSYLNGFEEIKCINESRHFSYLLKVEDRQKTITHVKDLLI